MARSALALSTSLALIWLLPMVEVEVRYSMPLAVAIDCAIGVVTKPCITSWVAPGKLVSTVMVALSRFGYWRTGNDTSALAPTSRISRLTTVARTGRRMKRSVKDMMEGRRYWDTVELATATGDPGCTRNCPTVMT